MNIRAFSLSHFFAAFAALLFGYTLSLVVFIVEQYCCCVTKPPKKVAVQNSITSKVAKRRDTLQKKQIAVERLKGAEARP